MARTKVRNMGRKQQKAVFANMENGTSATHISDSDSKNKKEKLLKNYHASKTERVFILKADGRILKGVRNLKTGKTRQTNNKPVEIIKPAHAKSLGFKGLKKAGIKIKSKGDADGDGVKNSKDCKPLDKDKQDLADTVLGVASFGAGAFKNYADKKKFERSPAGRLEKAEKEAQKQRQLARARRLESEAASLKGEGEGN